MPVRLFFPVFQCECGEIFKREANFEKHAGKWGHFLKEKYTIVVSVDRSGNDAIKIEVLKGIARTGYL